MKTKLPLAKRSTQRAFIPSRTTVVSLKECRLNFGNKWDYAPAPEESRNYVIAPQHELFIGGRFVKPSSRKYFESVNPATEQTLTTIAAANAVDVDRAVKAARKAYDKVWSKMPGRERGKYLYRIARIIQEKSRELAVFETMDGGKTIKESRDVDLPLVAAHFFYYAGWADKLKYAFPGRAPQPLGVAGQIIPWNFPLLMAAWKIAPALACGNTVVLKPAETTSLTAMRLAQIFQEAELPEGVVNIVTGAGETGAVLVNHPDIDKIAFTGSTEVGKAIARAMAERSAEHRLGSKIGESKHAEQALGAPKIPKLTLELGGKAANILFEDAPIDQAIEGVIAGIYFNQGHVCCAGSRLFVQEGIYSTVIKKLRDRIQTLRVGKAVEPYGQVGIDRERGDALADEMRADGDVGVAQQQEVIALFGTRQRGPVGERLRFDVEMEGVELLGAGAAGGAVEVEHTLINFREQRGMVAREDRSGFGHQKLGLDAGRVEFGVPRRADTRAGDRLRAVAAINTFDRLAGKKRNGLILQGGVTDDRGCAVRTADILPEPDAAVFALGCRQGQGKRKQRCSPQRFEHGGKVTQPPLESTRKSSSVRRLQGKRLRSRGRLAGARGVWPGGLTVRFVAVLTVTFLPTPARAPSTLRVGRGARS